MRAVHHVRTLAYYDMPLVFEARDAIGGHYIATLGAGDEITYLVTGVAPDRLEAFRNGEIDHRTLIDESDRSYWYTTTVMPDEEGEDSLPIKPWSSVLDEGRFMPEAGFTLDADDRVPDDEPHSKRESPTKPIRFNLNITNGSGDQRRAAIEIEHGELKPVVARCAHCEAVLVSCDENGSIEGDLIANHFCGHADDGSGRPVCGMEATRSQMATRPEYVSCVPCIRKLNRGDDPTEKISGSKHEATTY